MPNFVLQIQEETGAAEEQPVSNRFTLYCMMDGGGQTPPSFSIIQVITWLKKPIDQAPFTPLQPAPMRRYTH
jgi:hypothetical protein